jgi:hypothetical protein
MNSGKPKGKDLGVDFAQKIIISDPNITVLQTFACEGLVALRDRWIKMKPAADRDLGADNCIATNISAVLGMHDESAKIPFWGRALPVERKTASGSSRYAERTASTAVDRCEDWRLPYDASTGCRAAAGSDVW